MKYFNLKFLTFFLTALLAFGVGWAETVTTTYTFSSKSWEATPENWSGSSDGLQFNTTSNPAGVQVTASLNGVTVTSPKSYNNISKIVITYTSTKNAVGTINVYVGNNQVGSQSVSKSQTRAQLTYTVSNMSGIVKFQNYCSTNSYGINSIAITYEEGGGEQPQLEDVTLSFPESSYTAFMGQAFTAPLSVDPSSAASEVTYSSSDESVATVDASGNVTPVALGTTTITASISNSETYNNSTAFYTLTVKPNPDELAILDFTSPNYWTPALPEGSDNKFVEETEFSDGTYTVKVAGSTGEGCYWLNSGDALLIGKLGAYLQLPAFDKPVERIVIDGHSSASGKVTQNIFVGDVAVSTETTSAKETQTYVIAPAYQAAGNVYTLRVTNANNTQIQKIYVYFKEQTGDPELSFNPKSQTINDEGYTFKLHGENMGGNVGVYVVGDDPQCSNEFSVVLTNGDQTYNYFAPDNQGRINNEDVVVTYTGRALNAQGKIGAAWGDVKAFAEVTYKSDIYIVGNFGDGWDFTDGSRLMSESGGIYTYELSVENANTFVVFARKVGEGVGFNTRYTFTPYSDGNWEMNADEKEGTLNFYGAQPIHFQYPGLYAIEIDASDNSFTITRTLPQVVKPKITPNGGNFPASQTVALSCETEGADIYYTTDNTEPSAENGTLYEGEITLTATTTLKAIAVKDGMRPSEVATATFTKTGIETLAGENGVNSLASGKDFTFVGEVVVTANKSYKTNNGNTNTVVFIRDLNQNNASGTGGSVFYNTAADLEVKTKLAPGWTGKTTIYNGWTEITNAGNITTNGTVDEVVPFDRSGQTLTQANQSEYIILRNITINGDKATWTDGSKTNVEYDLYDRFGVGYEDGEYEYLEGVVNVFINSNNNKIQVYPLELKEVVKPLAVTLPDAPAEPYKVGQEVKVKATVENGSESTVLTYKVGDETLTIGEDGYVTLPNKKAGNVVLTVTAVDGDKQATDTKTYVFDAADELTITLNPATGTYTVGDVQNVTVTVEGNIDANPTITYKFGEEGEVQNYSAETGIVLPTNEAGTINLIVMVDDDGYEHAGETTATGNYTVNYKALTITLDPENAEFNVGDGDDAKVKVTIENAVGTPTVTCKVGDETLDLVNGFVTLPDTKAGEVTLTVTAKDERESAQEVVKTGTYTFNAAPAFEITLTNTPDKETYEVNDVVNVKVAVANALVENPTITYTIGETREATAYDPENGINVTSETAGTVRLTVNVTDGYEHAGESTKTADYVFEKKDVTLAFGETPENVYNGNEITLTVTGAPEGATVTFECDPEGAVTFGENGKVTFNTEGPVTITAKTAETDEYEAGEVSMTFNVQAKTTPTLTFEPNKVELTIGDTFTAPTLNGLPQGETVVYTVENENPEVVVATVENNLVTITGTAGKATVTATYAGNDQYNGTSASYTIEVSKKDVTLEFGEETPTTAKVGDELTLSVTGAPDGLTVTYKSSDETVATVDENGKVTFLSEGEVTITANTAETDEYEAGEVSMTFTVTVPEVVAAPTFSLVAGSYTGAQTVNISCATEGATISYSTDGGNTWTAGNTVNVDKDMTIMAKAEKDGYTNSATVTAAYIIDIPEVLPTIEPFKGYYQIKNNGNNMYANIAGRKTLNFTDAENAKKMAGTVIWLETNDKGQVQSIRSQAADLQGYANRAMNYVPDIVELVADKLNADGEGLLLGHEGLKKIMEKFNESFDHHLYVEQAEGGWRLYGKTPSMQPVVDFYRENTAQVEAKLPMLEDFINSALDKLKEKIGGSSVFTPFSLHQIWENMGETLTEPNDAESTMAFYREVLNNKNYVWDFAYQTAMIYVNNLKNHPRYDEVEDMLGEYAQYINMIEQVRPDFKYYVVQKDNKPDFISEGNVDITKNAARTIWTLEPRTEFNVSIAENLFGCPLAGGVGGYATTLYTDFAYSVPDGVTAYKVTSIEGGNATIEALSGVIPAQTPVMLTAKEAGTATLTLSTEAGTAVTGNLLVGPDYLINEYKLTTPIVENIFNIVKEKLGQSFYDAYVAQYEHLMYLNSGTVNNKYFWGLKQEDIAKCGTTDEYDRVQCVVRSLEGGKFIDNMKVETNKAFLVTDEYAEITLNNLRGDVNHDGIVNIKDVTDLIDRLLEIPDPEHLVACEYCSDVNQNGAVNIQDVTVLIDILLGNTTSAEGGGN